MADDRSTTNPSLREVSRRGFVVLGSTGTHEEIRTGCLQRIADATELMAKQYQSLIDENQRLKRTREDLRSVIEKRDRTISALRGHLSRHKRPEPGAPEQPSQATEES